MELMVIGLKFCLMLLLVALFLQHIVHSMKDPSIAAFWLLTFPQIVGGFEFDEDVKQRIWWQYKVSPFFILHSIYMVLIMVLLFSLE